MGNAVKSLPARSVGHLSKICQRCGKRFYWSRIRSAGWERLQFCGAFCSARPLDELDLALERALMFLLENGGTDTISPSDAAWLVDPDLWSMHISATFEAARRLAMRGDVVLLQRGRRVDPSVARGAVEVQLARRRRESSVSLRREVERKLPAAG